MAHFKKKKNKAWGGLIDKSVNRSMDQETNLCSGRLKDRFNNKKTNN